MPGSVVLWLQNCAQDKIALAVFLFQNDDMVGCV